MKESVDLTVDYKLKWFTCPQTVTYPKSNHLIASQTGVKLVYSYYTTSQSITTHLHHVLKLATPYTTHVCESVGVWPRRRSTWQAVPRQPSDYHRPPPDFRLPARGKQVQRQSPDYHLPSVVVFRPLSSGFHLASPTSYRTVACYVFVCCCAFMF